MSIFILFVIIHILRSAPLRTNLLADFLIHNSVSITCIPGFNMSMNGFFDRKTFRLGKKSCYYITLNWLWSTLNSIDWDAVTVKDVTIFYLKDTIRTRSLSFCFMPQSYKCENIKFNRHYISHPPLQSFISADINSVDTFPAILRTLPFLKLIISINFLWSLLIS